MRTSWSCHCVVRVLCQKKENRWKIHGQMAENEKDNK